MQAKKFSTPAKPYRLKKKKKTFADQIKNMIDPTITQWIKV